MKHIDENNESVLAFPQQIIYPKTDDEISINISPARPGLADSMKWAVVCEAAAAEERGEDRSIRRQRHYLAPRAGGTGVGTFGALQTALSMITL